MPAARKDNKMLIYAFFINLLARKLSWIDSNTFVPTISLYRISPSHYRPLTSFIDPQHDTIKTTHPLLFRWQSFPAPARPDTIEVIWPFAIWKKVIPTKKT